MADGDRGGKTASGLMFRASLLIIRRGRVSCGRGSIGCSVVLVKDGLRLEVACDQDEGCSG